MTKEPIDPRWPRLLGLAVHEFRTPITVVAGYLRMVLKERAGPISDPQRKLLEEAEKSCGRLSALVAEMSDLAGLEAQSTPFNKTTADLCTVVREAAAALPPLPDRSVSVVVEGPRALPFSADVTRLRVALVSLLTGLRREVVTSDRLVVRDGVATVAGERFVALSIGEPEHIDAIAATDPEDLEPFDEWRGGSGLSLAIARRVFARHGGFLLAPSGQKAAAVLLLPYA